jgi:hypothetical protein
MSRLIASEAICRLQPWRVPVKVVVHVVGMAVGVVVVVRWAIGSHTMRFILYCRPPWAPPREKDSIVGCLYDSLPRQTMMT